MHHSQSAEKHDFPIGQAGVMEPQFAFDMGVLLNGGNFPISMYYVIAPTGGLCTACRNSNSTNSTNKQIRNIVRFFSRISGGPGDGPQIVRFFPGFPEVQGMVRKL